MTGWVITTKTELSNGKELKKDRMVTSKHLHGAVRKAYQMFDFDEVVSVSCLGEVVYNS